MKKASVPNHILYGYKRITIPGQRVYMCNKYGVVINAKTGRVLKQFKNRDTGYYMVSLYGKAVLVHRIVAILFVENPNPKYFNIVNHKNEIKSDNRAENLEWCTQSYNVNYRKSLKKRKELFTVPVKAIKDGEVVIYNTTSEASRKTGVSIASIRHCLQGTRKSTRKGYIFMNPEPDELASPPHPWNPKKPVKAIKNGEEKIYESVIEASRKTGVARPAIKDYITGRRKYLPNGYHFEFIT